MSFPPGLDAFLTALRADGVPVDRLAVTRLQHAFRLEPALNRVSLKHLLTCTLLKDSKHHAVFEALFEEWCPDAPFAVAEEAVAETAAVVVQLPAETVKPAVSPAYSPPVLPTATQPIELPRAVSTPTPPPLRKAQVSPLAWLRRRLRFRLPAPFISWRLLAVIAVCGLALSLPWKFSTGEYRWLWAALGLIAWSSALFFWRTYQDRAPLPAAAPAPRGGPTWAPLSALAAQGPALLDAEQVRTLVWGVGRFVSEDLTRQLDLKQTVAATARSGGVPIIHYQRATYPREVWLWRDTQSEDALSRRLVEELMLSLNRAGLPVRSGVFRDFPEWVRWREGQEFSPLVLEGHRQSALVAVLTDGAGLAMANQSELERSSLNRLLRGLADWPQLAFVDCGRGRHGLAPLLQPYNLRCIAPEDLPAFLGAGEARPITAPQGDDRLLGDARAWAAALALSPDPVDDDAAYALLRELQLDLSSWRLQDLLSESEEVGGCITWPPARRIELLNWLAQSESLDADSQVTENSLLDRALQFWLQRYAEERERRREREQDSQLLPWQDTLAAQRLTLEEGLLELWWDPLKATELLYPLYRGKVLEEEIRTRLAGFAPRLPVAYQRDLSRRIFLPWVWEKQPARVRRMLVEMDFGSGLLKATGSPTVALALGLALGITITAAFGAGGFIGALLGLAGLGAAVYMLREIWPPPVVAEMPAVVEKEEVVEAPPILEPSAVAPEQEVIEEPPVAVGPWLVVDIPDLLEMVELPAGTFWMGSPESDDQAYSSEKPQHEVTVSNFAMSRYVVTRRLYREVMKETPSEWRQDQDDDRLPANYVDWFEAVKFCNALSERQGLQPCYRIEDKQVEWDREANGYRLPTEAEWEYAVRAGTTTRWFCEDKSDELQRCAWFDRNAGGRVHPVGELEPNPWGLYDLAGNVWEWCWDWYGAYSPDAVPNPVGPPAGDYRVLRGGAYWFVAGSLRSADRNWFEPGYRNVGIGFRCVRGSRRQH